MDNDKPNAIEKSLDILLAFTPYNQELGTGEISRRLGLHKATASRILRTLAEKGFLQQDPEGNKTLVRFSRKTKQQYVASEKEGKATGWSAFFIDGKWTEAKK